MIIVCLLLIRDFLGSKYRYLNMLDDKGEAFKFCNYFKNFFFSFELSYLHCEKYTYLLYLMRFDFHQN